MIDPSDNYEQAYLNFYASYDNNEYGSRSITFRYEIAEGAGTMKLTDYPPLFYETVNGGEFTSLISENRTYTLKYNYIPANGYLVNRMEIYVEIAGSTGLEFSVNGYSVQSMEGGSHWINGFNQYPMNNGGWDSYEFTINFRL